MKPPAIPVVLLGLGAYLAWFGVHYWRRDVKWPTDPVKAVLTGKPLPGSPAPAPWDTLPDAQQNAEVIGAATEGQPGAAPAHSGTYDTFSLGQLWASQGGSSATAFAAANVAMAESSGNPDATSANPDGGTNVGLWQLDTKGVGAGYTIEQLKDPATNARITVMHTANGTNWSAWSDAVVKNGIYVGPKV